MSKFHYFVGISIPQTIRASLAQLQQELELEMYYRRVTHPEDFHITLSFIGEVSEDDIPQLTHELEQITISKMNFELSSVRGFGTGNPPRVLYAGIEASATLQEVEESVFQVTKGYHADRKSPFVPHITLAKRAKPSESVQFSGRLEGTWETQSISLFRVHKGKQPSYEMVATFTGKGES